MPRLPRLQLDGAVYLVTSEGGSSEPLFQDAQDYEAYLGFLQEYKTRYSAKLFAYCLLPTAAHLCLEPGPGLPAPTTVGAQAGATLSALMHDITAGYTRYYNRRYGRSGHLVRERFKAVMIEKSHALLLTTAYLHRYPTQAGLSADFRDYLYTSYPRYQGSEAVACARLDMAHEIREVVSTLPTVHAPEAYEQYVAQLGADTLEEFASALRHHVVGSEAFVQRVKEQLVRARLSDKPAAPSEPVGEAPETSAPVEPEEQSEPELVPVVAMRGVPLPFVVTSLVVSVLCGFVGDALYRQFRAGQPAPAMVARTLPPQQEPASQVTMPQSTLAIQHAAPLGLSGLEETEWDVRMMPMAFAGTPTILQDRLSFTHQQVSSNALAAQGYASARYTMTPQPDGRGVWETIQVNPRGELVSWKGEWQGTTMRGVVTKQAAGKTPEHFTFVGTVWKVSENVRSEI